MRRVGQVPWPTEVAEEYLRRGHWRRELLGALPGRWARRWGDRVAVVGGDRSLTYAELALAADAVARQLLALGLRDGDNVVLQLPNRWEFVPVVLGCARIGVAPVMALPAYRDHELSHLADAAGAAAVVVPDAHRGFDHEALAHRVAAGPGGPCPVLVVGEPARRDSVRLRVEPTPPPADDPLRAVPAPEPEDVVFLLLSGGTTGGLPKLIARTHNDYEYNVRRMSELSGLTEDSVCLVVLPAGHNFALGCPGLLGTLGVGGTVVMLPSPEPEAALAAIARHRVTTVALVPAVAQRWLDRFDPARDDVDSLKVVQVGGARCPADVASRLGRTFGCTVQQVYGMAEGLLNCTRLDDPSDVVVDTQGRPISPDDEILLVDADGVPAEHGELLTRGPYTPRGYFRGGAHNAGSFTPDGWYRTGDVVRRHPSGNLVVEGRTRDLINRAGEKISAAEVEDLAQLLPHVRAAAAIAVPDPDTGERVCLCVVLRPGAALALSEVREVFRAKGVAAFKIPERLEVLDELPLTPVGKPDKKRLRQLFGEPVDR
ncbi:AMP-binding protein [Micromonospora sp. NPDC002296]|uniref:(2,3-dihydroxybenzoyl)adenylate synthase n=1 Tax=Micromonospora sp. NPDC002296 TaxID=3154271 RepID=UPI0033248A1E